MKDRYTAKDRFYNLKLLKKCSKQTLLDAAHEYIEELEHELHIANCKVADTQFVRWPRIRELAEEEQVAFRTWLTGQTCPLLTGLAFEEQDGYYPWDYDRWKSHLKGEKILWD